VRGQRWTAHPLPAAVEISLVGEGERRPPVGRRAMQIQLGVSAARELLGNYGGSLEISEHATVLRIPLPPP
jgi:hypothetical protein